MNYIRAAACSHTQCLCVKVLYVRSVRSHNTNMIHLVIRVNVNVFVLRLYVFGNWHLAILNAATHSTSRAERTVNCSNSIHLHSHTYGTGGPTQKTTINSISCQIIQFNFCSSLRWSIERHHVIIANIYWVNYLAFTFASKFRIEPAIEKRQSCIPELMSRTAFAFKIYSTNLANATTFGSNKLNVSSHLCKFT